MATSKENNWGGMSPSKAKISAPNSVASTLKSKAATGTAKAKTSTPKPATPVQYGRGGAYAAAGGAGAINVGNLINDYFSGVKERIAAGAADTGVIPTPATAGIVKPSVGVPAYLAKPQPAAGPSASTAARTGSTGKPAASRPLTDLLRVPGIESIYAPVIQQLDAQQTAANKRYQDNAANLKNIFGALSGLAAQDKIKIQEQYAQSLAAASGALQQRTAAANEATAAGVAQAQATGAERGMGPGMAVNPLQTATAEGNARATEYQTTWDNLQRANEAQAIADTSARGAGYGSQQVAALQGLQQSLEDRLMQIGGNTAQVQSDIAAAKFGQETNIAQAKYAEAVAARNAAIAAANAKANSADKIPALDKLRSSLGTQRFNALTNQISKAYGTAYGDTNPATATGTRKEPTIGAIVDRWVNAGGNRDLLNEARTIAERLYGK